jgi:RNA polymerase sigma-70 factor (ECF subfamily)
MPRGRVFPERAALQPLAEVNRMIPLVYKELRGMAQAYLRRESPGHTLQATALVNEAYLKVARQERSDWQGQTHLRAAMAYAMRQILVDHARGKKRGKRWGSCVRVELGEGPAAFTNYPENILALDQALERLAAKDPRKARIVELRLFGGFTVKEVAELLCVSVSTVEQEWTFLRAWLRREFSGGQGDRH